MYKQFRSRGEKIISLLPQGSTSPSGSHSSDESDPEGKVLEVVPKDYFLDEPHPFIEVVPVNFEVVPPFEEEEASDSNVGQAAQKRAKKGVAKKRKLLTSKKRKPFVNIRWDWKDGDKEKFRGEVSIPDNYFFLNNEEEPYEYFTRFFSQNVLDLIVFQSNLYFSQKTGNPGPFKEASILNLLGIELIMGVVKMPSYRDYWAQYSRYDKIASVLSLKKYEQVRQYLHFADNEEFYQGDRYYKIRTLMNLIRNNCISIDNERRQSIDEMMIPYKGKKAGSRRQYIRNKPIKWGFKMFVRAGISGLVYDFIMYDGQDTFKNVSFTEKENSFSMAPKVILSLCKSLPQPPALYAVYFDNFFSTLPLMVHLRQEYGILSLGTIRENRLRCLKLPTEAELKKTGRGTFVTKVDNANNIVVTKWLDSKSVVLASTFVGNHPISNKNRWSQDKKHQTAVSCPRIVEEYNKHMGGVDLADMLLSLYRTQYKSHKWYLNIFWTLLDLCINNAWLLYRRDVPPEKRMRLKHFRLAVAQTLISRAKPRPVGRPRSATPAAPDQPGPSVPTVKEHLTIYSSKGRCRFCKTGQTSVLYEGCGKRLCLLPARNCFLAAHN